jgi:hypothetical protein
VATTLTNANAAIAPTSSAGGAPSHANATGTSIAPPAMSCHDVSESTSTSPPQRFARMYPNDDIDIAAIDASTPQRSTAAASVTSISTTPPRPITAPASESARSRSDTSSQAKSIITIGDVAMTVDAMLVGSNCAAM